MLEAKLVTQVSQVIPEEQVEVRAVVGRLFQR